MNNYFLIIGGHDIDSFYNVESFLNEGEAGIANFEDERVGGCLLNVAQILSAYGNDVKVLDYLKENDDGSKLIIDSMNKANIDTSHILFDKGVANGRCLVMKKDDEKCIYIIPSVHPVVNYNDIKINSLINNSKLIYSMPHTIIKFFDNCKEVLINAKEKGVKLAFDGESQYQDNKDLEILELANYIFMNKSAYKRLSNYLNQEASTYLFNKGVEIICVTDGSRGSDCLCKDNIYHQDAIKVEGVIDSTGAGDAFAATFIDCLFNNYDLKECLKIASYAGARACLYEGGHGGVTSKDNLLSFIRSMNNG